LFIVAEMRDASLSRAPAGFTNAQSYVMGDDGVVSH